MWFWLSLASALFGALEIIINKHALNRVSAAVLSWALLTLSTPLLIPFLIKEGIPSVNQLFFVGICGSAITYVFSKTMINTALKENLISKILPLTAFSGVFTYLFGLLFLSESIRFIPVLGLLSVVFGSYILNADQAKEDVLRPFKLLVRDKASILFLVAILLGSLTAVFDKFGMNNTTPVSPAFTIFVEQSVMSVMLTMYLFSTQKHTWMKEVKDNFLVLFISGIIFVAVSLLIFYAYTDGPVALTLGIKRLQIFFVLLLSYFFFKDKPTKHAWVATAIMVLGVILIRIG